MPRARTICIGGGPAGLTAAYLLSRRGWPVTVLEADPVHLGGLARTVAHGGYLCDVGGHRFYSKSAEVTRLWREILGDDLVLRRRKSRIYYRGRFFDYPLRAGNALRNLGPIEAVRCVASWLKASAFPVSNPRTFEQWVSNRFGRRLFSIFFESYTEKVWGMRCSEISADWAAQRIKDLSLWSALRNAIFPGGGDRAVATTLIDTFHYPRKGPGMMWERAGREIESRGGGIEMGRRAVRLRRLDRGGWEVASRTAQGDEAAHRADCVISSVPIRELIAGIEPVPPPEVSAAAAGLRYRDFLAVGLVVEERRLFDDHWLYIHDPGVKVGRIQNVRSWSPEMVPDSGRNCYVMEYFCFEGDDFWTRGDAGLIACATRELVRLGLARPGDVSDGFVVRQKKAYPVYDPGYADRVQAIRRFVETECPGLHLVGRNGMHRYNNQDHAMMTAMLAVENVVAGKPRYDVWKVNQDAEYVEDGDGCSSDAGGRTTPRRVEQ